MHPSPRLHGEAGIFDELILIVEGIVIVALLVTYMRNRKRPQPPGSEPPAPAE